MKMKKILQFTVSLRASSSFPSLCGKKKSSCEKEKKGKKLQPTVSLRDSSSFPSFCGKKICQKLAIQLPIHLVPDPPPRCRTVHYYIGGLTPPPPCATCPNSTSPANLKKKKKVGYRANFLRSSKIYYWKRYLAYNHNQGK